MKNKKPKNTHEELMQYVLSHQSTDNATNNTLAEDDNKNKTPLPVIRHPKQTGGVAVFVLTMVGIFTISLAFLFFFYPRSVFFAGLLPTPVPIEVSGSEGSNTVFSTEDGLILTVDNKTKIEWTGRDFRHSLEYSVVNKSNFYSYPTISLNIKNLNGETINTLEFALSDDSIAPGKSVKNKLFWDDLKTQDSLVFELNLRPGFINTTRN